MNTDKSAILIIKSMYPSLFDIEKRIADFILSDTTSVINMTVAQLAKRVGVAESSIIRLCQRIGFSGFTQLKINIASNIKNSDGVLCEDIDINDDFYTITSKVFSATTKALADSFKIIDRSELDKAVDILLKAKRIEFYGVGSSAPIASDAYYRFMRIGIPAYVATDPHISRISASMLDSDCAAVGISHTGRTVDTLKSIEIAKSKGAKIVCITSFQGSAITKLADAKLITCTNETRLLNEAISSRVAQIVLLDSLFSCVAVKKYDSVIPNIKNMKDILKELRID